MARLDELRELLQTNIAKVTDLIRKEEEVEVKKKTNPVLVVFMIIGIIAAVAAAAYGIYKFLTPDYKDDFDDDFDDFDDDFFDDDDDDEVDVRKDEDVDAEDADKFED